MASGDSLLQAPAWSGIPPASNGATFDTRNNHPVADFDASTNESLEFTFVMPQHYGGGGIDVKLHVSFSSATSGHSDWDVFIERIGSGSQDVDSDGFAANQSADNTTVPATSGHVQVITVSFTNGAQMDSVAAGELFRVRVTRDALNDTAAGDAELHAIEIQES